MFDLVKNKYENREMGEMEPIVQQVEENRKPNFAAITLIAILYIVPISLITYGAIHLKDCPAENMVAITLIVLGGLCLLSRLLNSPNEFRDAFGSSNAPKSMCLICLNLVLQIILLAWYCALCYLMIKMKPDTNPEDHDSPNYCELQFYRNIYWGSVIGLGLIGLLIVISCCAGCYVASRI